MQKLSLRAFHSIPTPENGQCCPYFGLHRAALAVQTTSASVRRAEPLNSESRRSRVAGRSTRTGPLCLRAS